MKFLGVDLGWQSQPSGLCCLSWQQQKLRLLHLNRLADIPDVLACIDTWVGTGESAIIAVDAPTLIANPTGMRLADRLAHKHFGRYHAGCYPANLNRPFAQRTVEFGLSLEARGFVHAPMITPKQPGRHQIEVFPHPAIVHLFGLNQILKYKKGRLAERRAELIRYRNYILTVLPTLEPQLDFLNLTDTLEALLLFDVPQTGVALKALEDQLDSLICAYVAAHWWYWGQERNWVLGAETPEVCCVEGYIVVPVGVKPLL
jgi:predicted RNase H-like nuclease